MSPVAETPLHRALGLTDGEFDRIRALMEREPNDFELAVFSLLWSEHCGYKHSALLLRRFPLRHWLWPSAQPSRSCCGVCQAPARTSSRVRAKTPA